MKKILIFTFIFSLICFNMPEGKEFSLLDYYEGEYVCYSEKPVSNEYINTGSCYINFNVTTSKNVIGESVKVYNFELGQVLKDLNANVIKTESLESGAVVIYAFSKKIPQNVVVKDKEVNLQIAHYEEYSIIGWPLILGSF